MQIVGTMLVKISLSVETLSESSQLRELNETINL